MKLKISLVLPILIALTINVYSQNKKIFDGFKTMVLPRSEIPIGAIWTKSGPMGKGANEDQLLSSNSYSEFNSSKSQNLKTDLELKVKNFMDANIGMDFNNKLDVSIESVTVVQLNDIEILKNNIGNEILYEGIKTENITYTTIKENSAELKANLLKVFKNMTIIAETEIGNTIKITTHGENLFIAYRVVRLEQEKTKEKKVKFVSQSSSGVSGMKFSSTYYCKSDNYSITLCPCEILSCVNIKINENRDNKNMILNNSEKWLNNCLNDNKWEITIIDKNNIANGQPSEKTIRPKLPFDIWNKNFALSYRIKSEGIEIDYLSIEHLYFDVTLYDPSLFGKYVYMPIKGADERVKIIKERILFINVIPKENIGW